ncbi:hypothetical protein V1289_007019 [Bradyrhizobium sp. AZCC 2289]
MEVRTEKSVGLCLPMASVLLVRPGRRFRLSRFKGNYIIRDLTRLRNSTHLRHWAALKKVHDLT